MQQTGSNPIDLKFKRDFETLVNDENQPDISDMVAITHDSPYIPLDDMFVPLELDNGVKRCGSK